MQVLRFSTLDDLAPMADHWDRLARGVPFRSWGWMSAWWRHYGLSDWGWQQKLELFVLVVLDGSGMPLGIAPWYCRPSVSRGRLLRFLGVSEVCGDYLSVLCQPGREEAVTAGLADWLSRANRGGGDQSEQGDWNRWDLLELTGLDAEDAAMGCLADQLACLGHPIHRRRGPSCWRIALPKRWEDYLAMLSKSHRKQLRRMKRKLLDKGRVAVHCVERLGDLERAEATLIDLHQRRRRTLGQPGCYSSPSYSAFHREVMPRMLSAGQLQLSWITMDGRPLAAEYHLAGGGVVYAYQSGVEPEALKLSPGQLSNMIAIRRAMAQGCRAFDFLRGDEPYKAHWRAAPRPTLELRIAADRPAARLRHGIWLAGSNLKQWFKSGRAVPSVES